MLTMKWLFFTCKCFFTDILLEPDSFPSSLCKGGNSVVLCKITFVWSPWRKWLRPG